MRAARLFKNRCQSPASSNGSRKMRAYKKRKFFLKFYDAAQKRKFFLKSYAAAQKRKLPNNLTLPHKSATPPYYKKRTDCFACPFLLSVYIRSRISNTYVSSCVLANSIASCTSISKYSRHFSIASVFSERLKLISSAALSRLIWPSPSKYAWT